MSLINNLKSADSLLRKETNFLHGGLQLTVAGHKAVKKAFHKFAEQFIDAATEIATVEKENLPQKIKELKDFLL